MKILYQSTNCAILNKPIRVHSDECVAHCTNPEKLSDREGGASIEELRGWVPAHRLDFETSGCLLVCPPEKLEAYLALFKDVGSESTHKIYLVGASREIHEVPAEGTMVEGVIVSRYRGSKSVSFFENGRPELAKKWHSRRAVRHHIRPGDAEAHQAARSLGFEGHPYVIRLHSGARHQIRAALKALGAPIINDPVYGWPEDLARSEGRPLELHAWKLKLVDPFDGREISATAPGR